MTAAIRRTVTFPGVSLDRLQSMLGAYNGHLKQIEQRLDVTISHRADAFFIDGEIDAVERAEGLLHRLHDESEISNQITADTLHLMIQGSQTDHDSTRIAPGLQAGALSGPSFAKEVASAQATVDLLQARGINRIVALTHIGNARDLALAAKVNGLDAIVGGHSHSLLGDLALVGDEDDGVAGC